MIFSDNIKYLIQLTGLSQTKIADIIGIDQSAISRWKAGHKPAKVTLKRLARFFSETLHLDYALFEDGATLLTKNFTDLNLQHKNSPSNNSLPQN